MKDPIDGIVMEMFRGKVGLPTHSHTKCKSEEAIRYPKHAEQNHVLLDGPVESTDVERH